MIDQRRGWLVIGVAAAIIALASLRWANTAALGSVDDSSATQIRLSFSARPERIERCTELSDAELAKLPAHMRLRTRCEGFSARYLLTIAVGDRRLTEDTLRGGGLRHDRPLHVFREYGLVPGTQRVHVELTRLDPSTSPERREEGDREGDRERRNEVPDTLLGIRAERERDERDRRTAEAIPPRLVLDTIMAIPRSRVVLVTFDNGTRRLVARLEP
jgi:hypothetical protein